MIENPPGFIVRTEAEKAASDNGFRLKRGLRDGWVGYASTTAQGEVWVAATGDSGPWFLALTHPGVIAEFGPPNAGAAGLDRPAWVLDTVGELHRAIDRAYRLGLSLPNAPLLSFEAQTFGLPRSTEIERLVVQRIGQDIFRDALMQYWGGRCPLAGIANRRFSARRISSAGPNVTTTPIALTCTTAFCCRRSGMLPSTGGWLVSPMMGMCW